MHMVLAFPLFVAIEVETLNHSGKLSTGPQRASPQYEASSLLWPNPGVPFSSVYHKARRRQVLSEQEAGDWWEISLDGGTLTTLTTFWPKMCQESCRGQGGAEVLEAP